MISEPPSTPATESPSVRRWYFFAFLAVMLAAAIIRGLGLTGESFWYDEGYTLYFTDPQFGSLLDKVVFHAHHDPHPFLYFVLIDLWRRVSDSMAWLRLSSVLMMLGAMAIVWRTGIRSATPLAALIALSFLALSRTTFVYSVELRMYALGCLFASASLYFFMRLMLREEGILKRDVAGLALANGLLMLTHYTGAFLPMCEYGALLLAPRATDNYTRGLQRFVAVTIAMVGSAVVFLPQIPWFLMQGSAVGEFYWLKPPDLVNFSVTLHRLMVGKGYRFGIGWPNVIKIMLYAALMISLVVFGLRRRRRVEWILFCCAFGPLSLAWVLSHVGTPVFLWRSFMYILLPMSLLLGMFGADAIARLRQFEGRTWLAPAASLTLIAYLMFTNAYGLPWEIGTRVRANYAEIISEVEELMNDKTLLVFVPNMIEGAFLYASRDNEVIAKAPKFEFPHAPTDAPPTGADPGFAIPNAAEWQRYRETCLKYDRVVIVRQYSVGDFTTPELANVMRQTHFHYERRHHYGGEVGLNIFEREGAPDRVVP